MKIVTKQAPTAKKLAIGNLQTTNRNEKENAMNTKLMSILFAVFAVFGGCGGGGNSSNPITGSSDNLRVIAAEGTSITAGERQAAITGYPSHLQDKGVWICNGNPGATSAVGLATLRSHLERDNPNEIVLEYGANNDSSPAEDLRQMIKMSLDRKQIERVIVTTISIVCGEDHDRKADRIRTYSEDIRTMYASTYGNDSRVKLADVEKAFDANGGCSLIGDGYHHPNGRGYEIMADAIRPQLL